MLEGFGSFAALLLAGTICALHPGYATLALLFAVAGGIVLEEITRPAADAELSRETER